jgi:plasmid stabilization system protein ParE
MKRLRVLRGAQLDALAASDWYEQHGAEVAERFRVALDHAVEFVAQLPGAGHEVPGDPDSRRIRVAGFPFWVVYEETDMTVRIMAVSHFSRRERYWRDR